jgi:hypothetical protein
MAVNQLGDGSPDGVLVAVSGAKVAFYGAAPVAIRATNTLHNSASVSTLNATSNLTAIAAWITEVTNTLTGLGVWQG